MLRVAAINSVGDFVLFLGKIGVMAATAAISVVWLKVIFKCSSIVSIKDFLKFFLLKQNIFMLFNVSFWNKKNNVWTPGPSFCKKLTC